MGVGRPIALGLILILALTGTANAGVVTLGTPLPGVFNQGKFGGPEPSTVFNTALPAGIGTVHSPVNGAVISWSMQGANGGPFKLRVVQPNPDGTYTAVGTSAPVSPTVPGLQTFPTLMPVRPGQIVALDNTDGNDEIGAALLPGAAFAFVQPSLVEGVPTVVEGGMGEVALAFNAQVLPAPTVTALSKESGSIKGGTGVVISGTDLGRASAVSFGSAPAASFTIDSESQISAVSPAAKRPGAVTVSVTTPAGTGTAARQFAYEACKVPKLKGKKLKKARKRLRKSACGIGKVKLLGDATRRSGEVTKQSPKPGKLVPPGTRVSVSLG